MSNTINTLFNSTERKTYFVQLILPIPVPTLFTYRVPFEFNNSIAEGQRVVVPFGKWNVLTGIIKKISEVAPTTYEARFLFDILEEKPAFNSYMLQFLDWIASYYMAYPGDVLTTALPTGLKVSSESLVQLNPFFINPNDLPYDEELLIHYLHENKYSTYKNIAHLTGKKNNNKLIKSLLKKEAIILFDKVKERFSPKVIKYIRLNSNLLVGNTMQELLNKLSKKPKQKHVLVSYLKQVPTFKEKLLNNKGTKKSNLLKDGCSLSSIKTLEDKKIIESFEVIESRFDENLPIAPTLPLSVEQEKVIHQILKLFEKKNVTYLHGVTGSGKTEVYIELIKKVLDNGEQVLFLVPEIALTTQLVIRLKKIFGSNLAVYHSRYSENERVEVWKGVQQWRYKLVIGVRSSLFLPFDNLGLIIIDEEHDTSYKQANPSPRYHARDSAIMLAHIHHAKVIMGSATPSIEAYYQTQQGNYGLATLKKRYGGAKLPTILTADIALEKKKKIIKGPITNQLFVAIERTLKAGKQVIIFQNRRGYAPFLSCTSCGWIPYCHHCDVSLTYHLYKKELRCHYCGYTEVIPTTCEECSSTDIKTNSYGTEQLEENLQLLFPSKIIARMDQDTTRKKYSFDKLINDFSANRIDILVGTQMVAKGLDFNNVELVGVFDIDRIIHFPDFRSAERTFNLITQVSGRSGRRKNQGEVIIQSHKPNQAIIKYIINQDYVSFYTNEIKERLAFNYPPFVRIIKITLRHQDAKLTANASNLLLELLLQSSTLKNKFFLEPKIYGPTQPIISKIKNKYIYEIFIKVDRKEKYLSHVKSYILESIKQRVFIKNYKQVQILFNVDPS